jgi:cysteine desulfurase
MIYLDNAATTRVHPKVLDSMMPYLMGNYGNPDSKYYSLAEQAKQAVALARQQVADLFGISSEEIIFTSGATEANNTVIKGVSQRLRHHGNHIITTAVEHSSVYETMKHLEQEGFEITYLDVDHNGRIDLDVLRSEIRSTTILVSVMWVNNETGAIFPVEEIAGICKDQNILFHTDATQAIGKVHTRLDNLVGISFLTASAHKIFGPKGAGLLMTRKDAQGIPFLVPQLIHGGDQEFGRRAGTSNVPAIVGFGRAAQIIQSDMDQNIHNLRNLENKMRGILENRLGDLMEVNNDFSSRVPGILNIRVKGINNQVLLKNVKDVLAGSTGSACSNSKPSRVLASMGYDHVRVSESIRLSLSPYTAEQDLDELLEL